MIRFAFLLGIALLVSAEPALAQSNNDDYTPLNSRIRRDRQFPLEPRSFYDMRALSDVGRQRSRNMVDQFARCLWDRSNENGRAFLAKTDLGFVAFSQIGIDNSEIGDYYPVGTCLERVAATNNSGVQMRYTAEAMRRWYLQAAYLDLYEDGPAWIVPGHSVAPRSLPLSSNNRQILSFLDLGDCVVAADPNAADYFFRTSSESGEEAAAIQQLAEVIGPCLPAGQTVTLDAPQLRVWLGEALWHAANNSVPTPVDTQEAQ